VEGLLSQNTLAEPLSWLLQHGSACDNPIVTTYVSLSLTRQQITEMPAGDDVETDHGRRPKVVSEGREIADDWLFRTDANCVSASHQERFFCPALRSFHCYFIYYHSLHGSSFVRRYFISTRENLKPCGLYDFIIRMLYLNADWLNIGLRYKYVIFLTVRRSYISHCVSKCVVILSIKRLLIDVQQVVGLSRLRFDNHY